MDILDAAATVTTRAERQQNPLGNRSLDIMKFVAPRPITTPADVANHLNIDAKMAGTLLARLNESGHMTKTERGKYSGVESVESVETPDQPLPGISTLSTLSTLPPPEPA